MRACALVAAAGWLCLLAGCIWLLVRSSWWLRWGSDTGQRVTLLAFVGLGVLILAGTAFEAWVTSEDRKRAKDDRDWIAAGLGGDQ